MTPIGPHCPRHHLLLVVRATDEVGGLETVVRDAAATLAADGYRVTLGVVGAGAVPAVFADLDVVTALKPSQLLERVPDADIIHVHSPTLLDWSLRLLRASRRRGTPTLVTLHLPAEPCGRHLLSRVLIGVRRVLNATALRWAGAHVYAPSRAAAAMAHRRLLRLVAVSPLIQGVPDRGLRAPAVHRDDTFSVAFVGRMVRQKRPDLLLEAVAHARARGVAIRADFVGDGPELRMLEERARTLRLDVRDIRIHGYLADPTDVIAASDLLVLPSTAEGCPVVVMEAAALGRATLVREGVEGVDEILPSAHFTMSRHADARELARRLIELSHDRHLVAETGQRARASFEAGFDLTAAGHRYASAYRAVVAGVRP